MKMKYNGVLTPPPPFSQRRPREGGRSADYGALPHIITWEFPSPPHLWTLAQQRLIEGDGARLVRLNASYWG